MTTSEVPAEPVVMLVDGNNLKICMGCQDPKEKAEFPRARGGKEGLSSRCRDCHAEARRGYRARHPERSKAADKAYYARNKAKARAYQLQKLYGISVEQYEEMMQAQEGLCALCGKPPSGWGKSRTLHIDHCHETGEVRSLLCTYCNTGLGKFNDNAELLRKAADYLERFHV